MVQSTSIPPTPLVIGRPPRCPPPLRPPRPPLLLFAPGMTCDEARESSMPSDRIFLLSHKRKEQIVRGSRDADASMKQKKDVRVGEQVHEVSLRLTSSCPPSRSSRRGRSTPTRRCSDSSQPQPFKQSFSCLGSRRTRRASRDPRSQRGIPCRCRCCLGLSGRSRGRDGRLVEGDRDGSAVGNLSVEGADRLLSGRLVVELEENLFNVRRIKRQGLAVVRELRDEGRERTETVPLGDGATLASAISPNWSNVVCQSARVERQSKVHIEPRGLMKGDSTLTSSAVVPATRLATRTHVFPLPPLLPRILIVFPPRRGSVGGAALLGCFTLDGSTCTLPNRSKDGSIRSPPAFCPPPLRAAILASAADSAFSRKARLPPLTCWPKRSCPHFPGASASAGVYLRRGWGRRKEAMWSQERVKREPTLLTPTRQQAEFGRTAYGPGRWLSFLQASGFLPWKERDRPRVKISATLREQGGEEGCEDFDGEGTHPSAVSKREAWSVDL